MFLPLLTIVGVVVAVDARQIHTPKDYAAIPVDYTFNETLPQNSTSTQFSSVPGCPSSIDGYPWVQYEDTSASHTICDFNGLGRLCPTTTTHKSPPTRRCYLAGFQGPCDKDMALLYHKGYSLGQCDCSCTNYTLYKQEGYCLNPLSNRIVVMISSLQRCYPLFEQGPCRHGEWLILDPIHFNPICEVRRCAPLPPEEVGFSFYHPYFRQCLQTGKIWGGEAAFDVVENSHLPQLHGVYGPGARRLTPDYSGTVATAQFPSGGTEHQGCPKGTRFSSVLDLCLQPFHHFK